MVKRIFECVKGWRIKRLAKPYEISQRELEVLIKYGSSYNSFISLIDSAGEKISRNYTFCNTESAFDEEQIVFALERKCCF